MIFDMLKSLPAFSNCRQPGLSRTLNPDHYQSALTNLYTGNAKRYAELYIGWNTGSAYYLFLSSRMRLALNSVLGSVPGCSTSTSARISHWV